MTLPLILDLLLLLSSLIAAVFAAIGGVKARGLTPDSGPNIRELVGILELHIYATKNYLGPLLNYVKSRQGLQGPWTSVEYDALARAHESSEKMHARITEWKTLDTTPQQRTASEARVWMFVGAALAFLTLSAQILIKLLV